VQATATLPQRPRTCTIFQHGTCFNQSVPTSIKGAVCDRENFWHLYIYISPKASTWRFLFKKSRSVPSCLKREDSWPTRDLESFWTPPQHINYLHLCRLFIDISFKVVYIWSQIERAKVLLAPDAPTFFRDFLSSPIVTGR
jgi:hypothetical protein